MGFGVMEWRVKIEEFRTAIVLTLLRSLFTFITIFVIIDIL